MTTIRSASPSPAPNTPDASGASHDAAPGHNPSPAAPQSRHDAPGQLAGLPSRSPSRAAQRDAQAGEAHQRPAGPASWQNLPPRVKTRVAASLPPQFDRSRASLGQTDRATHKALETTLASDRLTHTAKSVETGPALHAALAQLDALDVGQRRRPLTVLADRIETLPEGDRADAFRAVSEAVAKLPPAVQAGPLARLGFQVADLPAADRGAAMEATFSRADAALKDPATRIADRAQILAGLAYSVPGLQGAPAQQAALSRVLGHLDALPAESRGEAIRSLGFRLDQFDPSVRQGAHDGAFARLDPAAGDANGPALAALASSLNHLPDVDARAGAFATVMTATQALGEAARGPALNNLAQQIAFLPPAAKSNAVADGFASVRPLASQDHTQALMNLVIMTKAALEPHERPAAFDAARATAAKLDAVPQAVTLQCVSLAVGDLPPEARGERYLSTGAAIQALPAELHALPMQQLHSQFASLSEAEQTRAREEGLAP